MSRRTVTLTLAVVFTFAGALHASAQDNDTGTAPIAGAIARASRDAQPTTLLTLSQTPKRPGMLPVLYGTYAGLQVMDIVSTRKAIAAGAGEANPLMKKGGAASSIAIKAAAGAGTIYAAEKIWKKNRVGAIVMMAAMNGVSAAVVAHNNRNAARR